MKKRIFTKKRIISLTLCVVLLAAIVAVVATVFSGRRPTVKVAARTDVIQYFKDNGLTSYFESKANVHVKWLDYGTGGAAKVQDDLSKAEKDRPDVYMGLNLYPSDLNLMADQFFLDITSQIDSTTHYKTILTDDPALKAGLQTNGKIYSFPSFKEDYAGAYPVKAWINSAWLKKLNLSMPTTPDQLYTVLKAFKTGDPNGSGQPVTPLGSAYYGGSYSTLAFIVNAFIPTQFDLSDSGNYLGLDSNGKVYATVTDPRFKDALTYLNKLMAEKLVSPTAFTDKAGDMIKGSKGAEQTGVILASDLNFIFNDPARCADYEPLAPLGGSTIVKATSPQIGGFMIGKFSKNVDAALRLGDVMLSKDGTLTTFYGKSGWKSAGGQSFGGDTAAWSITDPSKVDTVPLSGIKGSVPYWYSADTGLSRQAVTGSDGKVDMFTAENWSGYLSKVAKTVYAPVGQTSVKYMMPEITYTTAQQKKMTVNGTDIRAGLFDYMLTTCRDFVTGKQNIKTGWDTYVSTLKSKGLDTMISVTQEAYDQQK